MGWVVESEERSVEIPSDSQGFMGGEGGGGGEIFSMICCNA